MQEPGNPKDPFPHFPLAYPEGWKELLESPEMADYACQLKELARLTQTNLEETWSANPDEVLRRWQVLLEEVAYNSISEDDRTDMSQAEILETALITLQANLEGVGWIEEGASFITPSILEYEGETRAIREELDIRDPHPMT